MLKVLITLALLLVGSSASASNAEEFGQFSVSLGIKDIKVSKAFYENLGFKQVTGEPAKGWVILQKGDVVIGLFTEFKNGPTSLTFNPKDVRAVQKALKKKGFKFEREIDEKKKGPDWILIKDPDGNKIMFDQH